MVSSAHLAEQAFRGMSRAAAGCLPCRRSSVRIRSAASSETPAPAGFFSWVGVDRRGGVGGSRITYRINLRVELPIQSGLGQRGRDTNRAPAARPATKRRTRLGRVSVRSVNGSACARRRRYRRQVRGNLFEVRMRWIRGSGVREVLRGLRSCGRRSCPDLRQVRSGHRGQVLHAMRLRGRD